ncbi:MAG: hypothetical protein IKB99_00840 [Lentisphaeria bacterium]|nr:hypothetical protein [Lentisphaeria bacterium]
MKKFLLSFLFISAAFLSGAEKVIPICFKQDPGIVIDGRLSRTDWADIKYEVTFAPGRGKQGGYKIFKFKGPQDISGSVKVAYRADGLYFGFNVVDDVHKQKCTGRTAFKGDHVELFLDLEPLFAGKTTAFGKKQFQILFSPGAFDGKIKPEIFMYHPVKQNLTTPVAAVKTPAGYSLEAFLPWSVFGLKAAPSTSTGKLIAMDFLISDTDGEEPAQEKFLYAGKSPYTMARGRMLNFYLSDSRGTLPADLNVSGKINFCKDLLLDGKTPEKVYSFDFTPVAGATPVLNFYGWNVTAGRNYAGYGGVLKIEVNGKAVAARMLRNKPEQAVMKNGKQYFFFSSDSRLILPYIKNHSVLPGPKSRYYIFRDQEDWCGFELDISSLLRKGKNIIKISIPVKKKIYPVMIRELYFSLSAVPSKRKAPAPTGKIPVIVPGSKVVKSQFISNKNQTGLSVTVEGEKYQVRSYWSIPEGKFVSGSNKYFTLSRKIIRKKELFVLQDTITNISGKDLPVKHYHEITAPESAKFYLNSFEVSKTFRDFVANHNNSSTFVKQPKSGLGLFPLDDVTRVHAENYVKSSTTAGLADRSLVLEPGKKLTTEIAVIPSQADYFDFLNILRRELDVNFLIKGSNIPMGFWWLYVNVWFYPKDQAKVVRQLRDIVKYTDSHYVMGGYGYSGTTYGCGIDAHNRFKHPREYKAQTDAAGKKLMNYLKKAAPGACLGGYYHCFIDYWPEAEQWYADEAVINASGEREQYFRIKHPNKSSGIYIPTLHNKFGKGCEKQIDMILKKYKTGNDFFYWDEFIECKVSYSYSPKYWDGVSGDIDPKTHKLLRKKSSLCLMSGDFRHAMVKKIKAANFDVMVNSQPRLRRIMNEKILSFTETAHIDNCSRVQVYTPIQLGNHLVGKRAEDPAVIYRQMLEGLDFGVLYYYYTIRYIPDHHTLTKYMFPITPLELHKGYIIGKEKIITKVSGLYGWNDASKHEVHVYDDKGWPAKDFKAPFKTVKGRTYTELRLPEDYSAVIIRK